MVVLGDGAACIEQWEEIDPDLILLDVMLPAISGVDVWRAIRATSKAPIAMVTAKSSEIDTVVGLEVGADDYVSRPYRLRELVARMRAVLRRTEAAPGTLDDEHTSISVGAVNIDPDRHEVSVDGREVSLPLKEFELLTLLAENAGRVLTRDVLIDRVRGSDYVGDTKTLDVHVKRLRSKIENDPRTRSGSSPSAGWDTSSRSPGPDIVPTMSM